jgi:hypothetical protein
MHLKRVLATHAFELEQFYLTLFEREPFLRRLSPQAKILSASSEGPRHVCGRDSSFTGLKWSGRMDLNHRPPGPEPGALARLRYAPTVSCRPSVYAGSGASATAVPRARLELLEALTMYFASPRQVRKPALHRRFSSHSVSLSSTPQAAIVAARAAKALWPIQLNSGVGGAPQ